jgi:hypothetical protein
MKSTNEIIDPDLKENSLKQSFTPTFINELYDSPHSYLGQRIRINGILKTFEYASNLALCEWKDYSIIINLEFVDTSKLRNMELCQFLGVIKNSANTSYQKVNTSENYY